MLKVLVTTVPFGDRNKLPLELMEGAGLECVVNPLNRKVTSEELADMIKDIDLSGTVKNKVNRWSQFMLKYPNIIEYVDVEESEYLMIAMKLKDLSVHNKRMTDIVKNPNASGDKINRYNDSVYVKYTHSEFHPSMMLGTSSACIPFPDHNQAPRNIYNFSQSKQGKGIYVTNERFRMDITYRLANPSYPLIQHLDLKRLHELLYLKIYFLLSFQQKKHHKKQNQLDLNTLFFAYFPFYRL